MLRGYSTVDNEPGYVYVFNHAVKTTDQYHKVTKSQ